MIDKGFYAAATSEVQNFLIFGTEKAGNKPETLMPGQSLFGGPATKLMKLIFAKGEMLRA
jgi:hypothetical protein